MAAAPDREFAVLKRGDTRDLILSLFRNACRQMVNPATNALFTEEEIATATAVGTRYWIEADAIDVVQMSNQQKALWLADQIRIDRAGTSWLRDHHGRQWGEAPLPASGSGGTITALAVTGTTFIGSTTVPDPAATYATSEAGIRYQVLANVTADSGGEAELDLAAIDTGATTNITAGTTTVLTWVNPPLGAQTTVTTNVAFTGGTNVESDAEFSKRLIARIRHKPASGNVAHFRSWGREATNSIEDAFIYPCAMNAGSVLVCITQKRSGASGPIARIPNAATLTAVRTYLTPPGSAVVPSHVVVLVVAPVYQTSDVLMSLAMAKGRNSGWADESPWPTYATTVSSITQETTKSLFRIHSDTDLPTGITAPRLMLWNASSSRFERLLVTSVTAFGGNEYTVTLSQDPVASVTVGDYVSPDTERREVIAEGIELYFDERGPGEVIDLSTHALRERAFRFPQPTEEWAQLVGASLTTTLSDALGNALPNAELISVSETTPGIPASPVTGPTLLTVGKVAVYSL